MCSIAPANANGKERFDQAAVEICERLTPWTVANPAATLAICGAKTPAQALESNEAGRCQLSEQEIAEIETQIEGLSGCLVARWFSVRNVGLTDSDLRIVPHPLYPVQMLMNGVVQAAVSRDQRLFARL